MNRTKGTRLLLMSGAVGPLLFITVFLIEGGSRPGYSAWRNYVSSLSLSDQGWVQIVNFIVCGVLTIFFAVGLRRVARPGRGSRWGPVLLGIFGLALISAGLFVTDPGLGYPPGSGTSRTAHGIVHGLSGLLSFSSLAAASFVMARRFAADPAARGWALYSTATGAVVALGFVAMTAFSTLDEKGILSPGPTGLIQRIAIVAGWGWIALLAIHLIRTGADVASSA